MKKALCTITLALLIFAMVLSTVSCGGSSKSGSDGNQPMETPMDNSIVIESAASELASGPNGETPTPANTVVLSNETKADVRKKGFKAALVWAGSGEWYNAMTDGATAVFNELGIKIVMISDADFDPAKQATDIETALAANPDIILTLPVDPVSGTKAYQPAVDKGVTIVFADNGVDNYTAGKQYVSVVTGDQYGMGRAAADAMAEAIGGKGKIGMVWFDVDYFVTNNRDNEFERIINTRYPDIEIVSKLGFVEENATEEPASTMILQNPDLKGIYCSWDVAAEGVMAAVRANNREDIKIVSHDLGATNCLNMANNGSYYAAICDLPYDIGATMAMIAVKNLIGEKTDPYYVVGLIKVTKDNLMKAWKRSLNKEIPANIADALDR
jgi:ribose transport system substrate-binding protein